MGFFGKKPSPPPPPPLGWLEWSQQEPVTSYVDGLPSALTELSVFELTLFAVFCLFFVAIRIKALTTPMSKEATLDMRALNRVNIFKECFLGYVNAGMLEPILAIASSDYDVSTKSLVVNFCQLLGLFSWLYLLSDAFDISDTQQAFIYWDRIAGNGKVKAEDMPANPNPNPKPNPNPNPNPNLNGKGEGGGHARLVQEGQDP